MLQDHSQSPGNAGNGAGHGSAGRLFQGSRAGHGRLPGRAAPLGGDKKRTLLAVLLLHANEVVSLYQLVDAIWGSAPCDSAVQQVRGLVCAVRNQLAGAVGPDEIGPCLVTHARGYELAVNPKHLDLTLFENIVDDARRARAEGAMAEAADRFTRAWPCGTAEQRWAEHPERS